MSTTVEVFEQKKKNAMMLLSKLATFVQQGQELGVEIHPDLIAKVNNALRNVQDEKLKVTLVGGFSEGKTSIAAAWMGKLDKSSMKISHQESSNEVKIYDIDDKIQLIDTPGLYGYKEEMSHTTQQLEKYKDMTKRYVSEAHLVLYVMDSSNPIKDSHTEDLKWLFRELNLLSRTVFVLSRFDDIADVADEAEYQAHYQTKKTNVIQGLTRAIELSDDEVKELSVVAVASNPFDMGVEHWLKNKDEFEQLSHIKSLQLATEDKVKSNGGMLEIVNETKRSVVADVIGKQLPLAQMGFEQLRKQTARLGDMCDEQQKDLNILEQKIRKASFNIEKRIVRHFEDLILQVDGLSIETAPSFFQREIGTEGDLLDINVREIFQDEVGGINRQLASIATKLESETQAFEMFSKDNLQNGLNFLKNSKVINRDNVMLARDGIKNAAKMVGFDIGKYLRFQPWGAVNWAKNLNGILAGLGIVFELWDSWKQALKQKEFQDSLTELKKNLNKQREGIVGLIKSENFSTDFFPAYGLLKKTINDLQIELKNTSEQYERFEQWKNDGEIIEAEFREI